MLYLERGVGVAKAIISLCPSYSRYTLKYRKYVILLFLDCQTPSSSAANDTQLLLQNTATHF